MEFANENIFENLFEAAKVSPALKSLDPLADLLAKPVTRISYKRKVKRNSSSAFMEFTKKDRNWLDLLLRELTTIHKAFQADASIIVVTAYPDLINLRDVKNVFDKIAPSRGVDAPIRLVFNKVGLFKKGELTAKDFKEAVDVDPSVAIAYDSTQFGTA